MSMKNRNKIGKIRWKKVTAAAAAVCLALGMTACGAKEDEPAEADGTVTAAPENTAVPTAAPTAEPTPEPTPTPDPAVTQFDETVPVGQYAPAESYSDRAMVAVKAASGVFVSWRSYEADSDGITFTLERNGKEIYSGSLTNYMDAEGKAGDTYTLTAGEGISAEGESTKAWEAEYQEFRLQAPEPQKMPNNQMISHTANDMSVGDLDGDGQLELIVKWYPDNAQDNSKDGYTATTILDAYDIDIATGSAELMWRIDLGLNIRSGAHYTQFQVWDYDGDGKAELICKTADGTTTYDKDLKETGHVGAVSMASLDTSLTYKQQEYDYRNTSGGMGRIVKGPEYLTAFSGETGEIIDTVEYIPSRGVLNEEKGTYDISSWGDTYANRSERYLAATAYVDEGTACAIFSRGYYGRTAITAWKLAEGKLQLKWYFDAPAESKYAGQGNHGLSVNDVDGDGFDEIIYGSLVMDHNGTPIYATGLGHGDAMHVSDWNGDGKLEVFQVHEDAAATYHTELHDAATGENLWGYFNGKDTGRGMAADIDPRYPGAEMWSAVTNVTYDCKGNIIYQNTKPSVNFSIFWDGDLLMELFDYDNTTNYTPQVQKWDWKNQKTIVLVQADGAAVSNGTKGNAGLVADICGDWREEVIVRDALDNNKIRLYSTNLETEYVVTCLLEDRAYREGVAWQNTAYNQPANLSVFLSRDVTAE